MTTKDETVVVTFALAQSDLQKINAMAAATDRSRSAMVRTLIRAAELPAFRGEVILPKRPRP